jgi:predicted transcriptional regulator
VLVQNDMQPSRRALLAAVEAHPGIHFNELARLTQQGRGAVQHHLKILEARGSIRMVRYGRYTCVYPAQAPPTPADGVLKSEVARRLDGMVRLTPGMTAADASRMLGVTYGAAAYHMRRMAEAGLVRLEENPLAAYPIPHGGSGGYPPQAVASSGSGPVHGGPADPMDH